MSAFSPSPARIRLLPAHSATAPRSRYRHGARTAYAQGMAGFYPDPAWFFQTVTLPLLPGQCRCDTGRAFSFAAGHSARMKFVAAPAAQEH